MTMFILGPERAPFFCFYVDIINITYLNYFLIE